MEQALYCDPGVYALDLENVFYREWLFAVPSCELPKAGAFATLQVGAYPLVITRGNDGMIRAFHNVCRHRGQRLCAKETGSTPKLVCPYHQWTYDLDGKLLYARDMQEGFDPAAHGLKKVHCVDLGGMVFICLAEVPPPISDLAPKLMSYLAPSGLKDAKVAFSSTIVENGNWKLVIENNRECYHCGGSHPSLCRTYSDNPRMTAMEGPDSASPDILDHWKRCEAAGLPSRFTNHPLMQWRLARIPLLNNAESYTMDTKAAVARRMGHEPRVAFLSYSTFGNPEGQWIDNVRDGVAALDKRQVGFEPVLEFDAEAQEIEIELTGLGFVEHTQYGNGSVECNCGYGLGGCGGKHRRRSVPVLVAQLLRDQFQRGGVRQALIAFLQRGAQLFGHLFGLLD